MRSARAGRALPDSRRRLSAVAVGVALLARAMAAGEDAPPIPSEIVRLKVESANFSASRNALEVVLGADIAEGWHVNAHQPTSKELIPTTLAVVAPAGIVLNVWCVAVTDEPIRAPINPRIKSVSWRPTGRARPRRDWGGDFSPFVAARVSPYSPAVTDGS